MENLLQHLSFQTVFDSAADAILIVNKSGQVVEANHSALEMLEYPRAEIYGLTVESLMPPRFRTKHQGYRDVFFLHPEKRSMGNGRDLYVLTRSGQELVVDIGLSPLIVKNNEFVLITFYPAKKRKEAELALSRSEERLQLAKKAAHLGVFDFDMTSQMIHWDDRMQKLWGYEAGELISYSNFISAIHIDDQDTVLDTIEEASNSKFEGQLKFEYRVINSLDKAERWILSTALMHFKQGVAARLIGVVTEITEQKKFEQALQAQRVASESILKQQIAARTTSAIAHELNQPLAAISAYSEVALQEFKNIDFRSDKLKHAVEGCAIQAQRAGASLHELLAYLQEDNFSSEAFDINLLIKESFAVAKADGFKVLKPILKLTKNMRPVLANRMQVQKVILNLLRNSVEAMRAYGLNTTPITIHARTNAENTMCHVLIQDHGAGIAPEVAKRIFEPFFTTKSSGIGMGLAISRALIESNGGQLWFEPNTPSGANFHFTLPFA